MKNMRTLVALLTIISAFLLCASNVQAKSPKVTMDEFMELTDVERLDLLYKTSVEDCTISWQRELSFTGESLEPVVGLKDGDKKLSEGEDYTVKYTDNQAVGTGIIRIEGKGDYRESVRKTFEIKPLDLTGCKYGASQDLQYEATGKEICPDFNIKVSGKVLKNGEDYNISFKDNIEPGEATAKVSGIGNYTGSFKIPFEITNNTEGMLEECLVSLANTYISKVGTYQAGSPRAYYNVGLSRKYGDDCTEFTGAFMAKVSGTPLTETWSGGMISTSGAFAKEATSAGWKVYTSDEIGSKDNLKLGDILVAHGGSGYSTYGEHAEVYIDAEHTFGWGSVKHNYPSNNSISEQVFGGHVHFVDGGHDYTTIYRYEGLNKKEASAENKPSIREDGIYTVRSEDELELIWAIVRQEAGDNYDEALAVISSAANRCLDLAWSAQGGRIYDQLTADGQYCYSIDRNWEKFLNGNVSDSIKKAVSDGLNGKRNHEHTSFRSYATNGAIQVTSDGNWYFG